MRKYIKKILIWLNLLLAGALLLADLSTRIDPENFWPFAFFGLAFPLLLLANVFFGVFWALQKKTLALISVVIIIVGWSNIGRYIQFNINGKPKPDAIRLMTYNVRLFNYYQWEKGNIRKEILNLVEEQQPGILCLQEVLTVENVPEQSEAYMAKTLQVPYSHIAHSHKPNENTNYGIATYSKYPIVNKHTIRFPNSYNICIYSDIKFQEDTIRVFNLHLQSIKFRKNEYDAMDSLTRKINARRIDDVRTISLRLKQAYQKRSQQVKELRRHIEESPYPVIICGDFNDTPVSYTYRKVKGNMKDAFVQAGTGFAATYRGKMPFLRIDFIFHTDGFKAQKHKIHKVNLSDHYPVSCELVIIP